MPIDHPISQQIFLFTMLANLLSKKPSLSNGYKSNNFFDKTKRRYCGVRVDGCYEWVLRSIKGFGDKLFNGDRIKPWEYINGGFQIVNKTHRHFFETMKKYYFENDELIIKTIDELKCGTDQTILNYMLHREKIDVKYLPSCYNLQDLFRKN